MSRSIEDLTPEAQAAFHSFDSEMTAANIDYIVTCTKRTPAEQLELWKKGREYVNGKWIIVDKRKCVTWTLKSRHFTGTAFDICILVGGKPLWNPGLDSDGDGIAEYTEAGIIGEKMGLTWGGRWSTPDAPHFQLGG